jgi:hypothetical protein
MLEHKTTQEQIAQSEKGKSKKEKETQHTTPQTKRNV